jgi:hypothetical protein
MSSSRKYAVVGLGVVAGPQPNRTRRQVAAEAVRLAIADGGLKRQDIDGAIEVVRGAGAGERATYADPFPRVLALPRRVHLFCASFNDFSARSMIGFMFMNSGRAVTKYSTPGVRLCAGKTSSLGMSSRKESAPSLPGRSLVAF